jgi:ABC-type polysaccharide/polyol phosphate export permease
MCFLFSVLISGIVFMGAVVLVGWAENVEWAVLLPDCIALSLLSAACKEIQ